jgi:hypothetical protein
MKVNLNVYDDLALNMKLPKSANIDTIKLTKLPDSFEPPSEFTEHKNKGEEFVGSIIP